MLDRLDGIKSHINRLLPNRQFGVKQLPILFRKIEAVAATRG